MNQVFQDIIHLFFIIKIILYIRQKIFVDEIVLELINDMLTYTHNHTYRTRIHIYGHICIVSPRTKGSGAVMHRVGIYNIRSTFSLNFALSIPYNFWLHATVRQSFTYKLASCPHTWRSLYVYTRNVRTFTYSLSHANLRTFKGHAYELY